MKAHTHTLLDYPHTLYFSLLHTSTLFLIDGATSAHAFPHTLFLPLSDEKFDRLSMRVKNQNGWPTDDFQPLPQGRVRIIDYLQGLKRIIALLVLSIKSYVGIFQ